MTQEVQPLTWQKRTNIEEHMQFFSKINEIIANLAPTVDEAEAAIAQATQAVATANAASAAASAAASQAQTAASTVAGYDARLTAAEDSIDTQRQQITVLQGRTGALETGMTNQAARLTAVEGREADYLKKAGAAQTVTSQIMVPTTATGTRDTQVANGTRIQNDLAAYEPMLRDTGNKDVLGDKRFLNGLIGRNLVANVPAAGTYTFEVSFEGNTTQFAKVEVCDYINNAGSVYWEFYMVWNGSAAGAKVYGRRMGPAPSSAYKPKFTVDNGVLKLIYFGIGYHTVFVNVTNARSWTNAMTVDVARVENPDYTGLTLVDVIE